MVNSAYQGAINSFESGSKVREMEGEIRMLKGELEKVEMEFEEHVQKVQEELKEEKMRGEKVDESQQQQILIIEPTPPKVNMMDISASLQDIYQLQSVETANEQIIEEQLVDIQSLNTQIQDHKL